MDFVIITYSIITASIFQYGISNTPLSDASNNDCFTYARHRTVTSTTFPVGKFNYTCNLIRNISQPIIVYGVVGIKFTSSGNASLNNLSIQATRIA